MTTVHPVVPDDLRVIMCLAFDHRAPAGEVAAFKAALLECRQVVSCCELTGTFDFMLEATLLHLADYHDKLDSMKGVLARLVARYEANFVCKRFVRQTEQDVAREVWVPCQDGLKRLDCSLIDKVSAEGDYMRIHVGSESWMVHATMKDLVVKLGDEDFVHVHRSKLIRCTFIDRLIHQGRRWIARLNDGSVERIAQSHVADVLAKLRDDPTTSGRISSNSERSVPPKIASERNPRVRIPQP